MEFSPRAAPALLSRLYNGVRALVSRLYNGVRHCFTYFAGFLWSQWGILYTFLFNNRIFLIRITLISITFFFILFCKDSFFFLFCKDYFHLKKTNFHFDKLIFYVKYYYLIIGLRVLAELSLLYHIFYFLKEEKKREIRFLERNVSFLPIFLAIFGDLYLQDSSWKILSLSWVIYLLITVRPFGWKIPPISLLGLYALALNAALAYWGFSLALQIGFVVFFYFFWKKDLDKEERECFKTLLLNFGLLIAFFLFVVFYFYYNQDYFFKDLHLFQDLKDKDLALLGKPFTVISGAAIINLCLRERLETDKEFLRLFGTYLVISLIIGVFVLLQVKEPQLHKEIANSLLFFGVVNILSLCLFLGFFKDFSKEKQQGLIPFFFSGVFLILGVAPGLYFMQDYFFGIGLLLFVLGVVVPLLKKEG